MTTVLSRYTHLSLLRRCSICVRTILPRCSSESRRKLVTERANPQIRGAHTGSHTCRKFTSFVQDQGSSRQVELCCTNSGTRMERQGEGSHLLVAEFESSRCGCPFVSDMLSYEVKNHRLSSSDLSGGITVLRTRLALDLGAGADRSLVNNRP
jgi:hypothetical protein